MIDRNRKIRLGLGAIASLLAGAIFFLQLPAEIYAGNKDEFGFSLWSMIGAFAPWALGLLAAAILLIVLSPKVLLPWLSAALAGFAVALWIQGSLLIHDFGLLDGTTWSIRLPTWRSHAEHVGVAATAVVVFLLALKRPVAASIGLAGLLATVVASTVPVLMNDTDRPATNQDFSSFYDFSPDKNILVVLMDSMQSEQFQEVVAETPAIADALDGFTYYPDTTGVSSSTYLAVPTIHSGQEYIVGSSIDDHYRKTVTERSFVNRLSDAGYRTAMIGSLLGICPNRADLCAGVRQVIYGSAGAKQSDASRLLNISLLRVAPAFLKKTVYNKGLWRISLGNQSNVQADQPAAQGNAILDDLAANLTTVAPKPTLKFLHLMNTHLPIVFTEKCVFLAETIRKTRAAFKAQTNCALQHFARLMTALKAKGIYDKTAIVLLSDHGSHGGWPHAKVAGNAVIDSNLIGVANPTIAIKSLGARGPFRTDMSAASLTDIAATVCGVARDCTIREGRSLVAEEPLAQRTRRFLSYTWARGMHGTDRIADIVAYEINGSLFDLQSWHRIPNKLALGQKVNFAKGGNARAFTGVEWALPDQSGARMKRPRAMLSFETNDAISGDTTLRLSLSNIGSESHLVTISVNGHPVGRVNSGAMVAEQEVAFSVPASFVANSKLVEIAVETDNPGSQPAGRLGLGVRWMTLDAAPTLQRTPG